MSSLRQALQELKDTPEEKIGEIFAAEINSTPPPPPKAQEIADEAGFLYEGSVTIVDHIFPGCRSIMLNDTASNPDNPDDALSLEDVLPHVVFLAEPGEHEKENLQLRIVIEKLDAE